MQFLICFGQNLVYYHFYKNAPDDHNYYDDDYDYFLFMLKDDGRKRTAEWSPHEWLEATILKPKTN